MGFKGKALRATLPLALALTLTGCLVENDLLIRTPVSAFYAYDNGIKTLTKQHLLRGRYLLFSERANSVQQAAFDLRERRYVWRTKIFPDDRIYYLAQNNKRAYAWPFEYRPGQLVVIDPETGEIPARLLNDQLETGAHATEFSGLVASEDRVYAITDRSGVAVFELDEEGLPTFVRKIVIPDIERMTTPTRGQLFYAMSIAMDPETQDVFVGSSSAISYGDIPDLYRIDGDTGEILWKAQVEYPDDGEDATAGRFAGYVSAITLAGDMLIVQAGQSVQAFDPETGERYWYYELRCMGTTPGGLTQSQLYVPETGRVYFGRGSMTCFYSVAAGVEGPDPWTLDTERYAYGATPQEGLPTYMDGVLYFFNGFLWAVDPYTGRPLSVSENLEGSGWRISIFNDGRYVYVPAHDGIYVFEPVEE